jgi:hypothetical protein
MKFKYLLPTTHRERRRSHVAFVEPADIAVMWSPKAACTTVMTWVFLQDGLLAEALAYSNWIHRYRLRRYQKDERYLRRLGNLRRYGRHVIKVVRNPFDRAVSSYFHAYRHGYEDLHLSSALGRPVDPAQRFSFREFVHFLDRVDITRCNLHHRVQATSLERHVLFGVKPHRIIKIEDGLEAALGQVERQYGLPPTDFSNPVFRSHHHTSRIAADGLAADRRDWSPRHLPPAAAFYDDDLVARVARLYAEDFRRYGYDPTRPV